MGITIFKIFIWGGISSVIHSENHVLRLRVKLNFRPYIRRYASPNENFEYIYPLNVSMKYISKWFIISKTMKTCVFYSHTSFYAFILGADYRPDIDWMHCLFSKSKRAKMLRIEVLFISKTLWYTFCTCVQNILKIKTFVIGMMKLVSFSLLLDVSPPKSKMPFWTMICYHKHIQHM